MTGGWKRSSLFGPLLVSSVVAGGRASGWGPAEGDALAINAVLVGLVRLEEVFVAKFLVAKFAIGFWVEDLNSASCGHRRGASGRRDGWP